MILETSAIDVVAIPTRDNVEELRRSVGSCTDEAARWGRRLEIVVMDDSRTEATVVGNRRVLQEAAGRGARIRHATPESRRRFAEALGREVGERGVVDFALLGSHFDARHGATRNAIALELSGRPFLSLDDDMSLRGYRSPEATSETVISPGDPTELRFFAGESETRARAEREDADVIGAHESLLGKAPAGRRVAATWTGFYGHCATPSPLLVLLSEGPSPDRSWADDTSFEAVSRSMQIIRSVRSATTSSAGFWTTGVAAYDGHALPPFLPVLRGEGLVFGALVGACTQSVLGYVPAVVEHRAGSRASRGAPDFARAARETSLAPVLASLIHFCAGRVRSDGDAVSLPSVGRVLGSLCATPAGDFDGRVAQLLGARSRHFLEKLRSRVDAAGASHSAWSSAARQYLQGAARADNAALAAPGDVCEAVGPAAAAEAVRSVVHGFARLLELWPRLHTHARALASAGYPAAEPVGEPE
jgi:hypothetical protein